MKKIAKILTVNYKKDVDGEKLYYKIGFHAVPSMNLLHCHVISKDF